MKIAFVYDAVYPWVKGGAEKRIYELGKRLVVEGNEVHIFGVKWWEGADIIEIEGMMLHGVCKPMELYVNGRRSISEAIVFAVRLLPHLIKEKFDVIDVSSFPYFSCFTVKFVSVFRRCPVIVTWHEVWGDYWYEYMGRVGFFGKMVELFVSKLTNEVISVSSVTGNNLRLLGVNVENVHLVSNGMDLKRIAEIPQSTVECDIIFIGRLIREKNVDVLIKSVDYLREKLPDVMCHIIGDGPEKERLMKFAEDSDVMSNIRFSGFMEYEDIIARIKASKVLVLPSTREGFGMVVIEAFACGVPVITVNDKRNAASLLVNEDTGFVVNLDSREICDAVHMLIKDDMLHESMAAASKEVAEDYDWNGIVKQLMGVYEGLM
ncbi:glycosyltransferase family 4 protein [Candidatus Pacearchaeota archaeon]|nr:glycosyltransferase family 4 protein [Candidatus Pacearchaeota archaeon]